MSAPVTPHELDREFLEWVRDPETFAADLRAAWWRFADMGGKQVTWRLIAIERELKRRGERLP